jgi:Uma2 family endonuclease
MASVAHSVLESDDPTVYPVHGDMGSNSLETFIRELLRPLVEQYLRDRGTPKFVGSDQYIYWKQYNATRSVAPDLYVVSGLPPQAKVSCLQTWKGANLVPSFALEVVSEDKQKDYVRSPARYAELGTKELILYDPEWQERPRGEGRKWQVFRRLRTRGFVRVAVSNEDRVYSKQLGAWFREIPMPMGPRIRLAVGEQGETLYATELEQAQAQAQQAQAQAQQVQAQAQQAQAQAQQAQAQAQQAQAQAQQAQAQWHQEQRLRLEREAELQKLRAELEALKNRLRYRRTNGSS